MVLMGCGRKEPAGGMTELTEQYVYTTLAFSPVAATAAGYHVHAGTRLDERLDDYSEASLARQRKFYQDFQAHLQREVNASALPAEDLTDHDMLRDQAALALFQLDVLEPQRHNPTVYVELIGNAIFTPFTVEYAPFADRARHIIARLRAVPAFLDQAKANLVDSPEVWTDTAIEENEGNIRLINETVRKPVPSELSGEYDQAASHALEALMDFSSFLRNELKKRPAEWRLGPEKYARKFRLVLGTDESPDHILQQAEAGLEETRLELFELAKRILNRPKAAATQADQVIRQALEQVAQTRSTPSTYMTDARRDLFEIEQFVRKTGLVPLVGRENLQIIDTPEFMRGIYAVGGFNPAPPLEPGLGAFYWLTPIPSDWPEERVQSKLKEYNAFSLKLLTIHEAMPGHYLQFEYADNVEPESRRLLRAVYGSGTYIEGWAVYSAEAMLDAGYLENSPELRLTFLKQMLRVLANAILDIRLHTMGLADREALDLMVKRTFQETEEAQAKLRRAKLSSCQLPTYYAGHREWKRLRDHCRKWQGDAFQLARFHESALRAGAVPVPALARLLTGKRLGE